MATENGSGPLFVDPSADRLRAALRDKPRALTCGLYDHVQWSKGPDCRDFVFVTEDIGSRVRRVEVNETTDASDHQPILIELAD